MSDVLAAGRVGDGEGVVPLLTADGDGEVKVVASHTVFAFFKSVGGDINDTVVTVGSCIA